MSAHIRTVLERSYQQNANTKKLDLVMISFCDQAEIRSDFDIFCQKKGVERPIRIVLTPNDYFYPLAPVMYTIREILNQRRIPLEQIADILNLEVFENQLFTNMLKNSNPLTNFYMPSDVEYIQHRMHSNIKAIFNHLLSNDEKMMIGISNIQYAGPTSLRFLLDIFKKQDGQESDYCYTLTANINKSFSNLDKQRKTTNLFATESFSPLGHKNETLRNNPNAIVLLGFSVDAQHNTTEWLDWESKFEHICSIVRPTDSETGFSTDNGRYEWPQVSKVPNNVTTSITEGIKYSSLLLNFFCCEEMLTITSELTKKLRVNRYDGFASENEVTLYHLNGRAQLYLHNYEEALISFDLMYEKAQYRNNNDDACRAYTQLAYTHIFRSDFESVLHFAEMAAHLGEISMNLRLVAIANFCLFVAYDRSSIRFGTHNLESLLNGLERQDLMKELTYVLRNSFAQAYLDPALDFKQSLEYCNKAINIANRNGIRHELAAAHHCRGIVLSNMGRIAEALHAYRLSEEIYDKLDVPIELTHVYNSIGYLYIETEDFPQAHEYFLKVLRNSIKLNDYSEITITLYNLSKLYILTGLYKESLHTLNILQEVMSIRGTLKLPFHNLHHILLSKAIAYASLGEVNFATQMLKRSTNIRSVLAAQTTEMFMYNLVQAMIYGISNNKQQATLLLGKLEPQLEILQLDSQLRILFYLNGIKIFAHFCMYEQSYHFFKTGFAFATKNQLFNSQNQLINAWKGIPYNATSGLTSLDTPLNEFNQIIPLVEQERRVNILWRQVHELRLGSMLHNFSLSVENDEQLAAETLRLLSSHFNINGGFVYYIDNDQENTTLLKEFNSSRQYSDFSFARVQQFCNENITSEYKVFSNVKIGTWEIYRIAIFPLMDRDELFGQMMLFTFDNKTDNKNESSDSINFIAQQLSSQLITMIQRAKLIKISTTDMLTGLYNRMEFNSRLQKTIKQLMPNQNIALGFIDLDNFKYYNDNLGHEVGDKLLIWFSKLLNSRKAPNDVACRWGGDEFLLLMKNCTAMEAEQRMQNILDELKAQNGYKAEIEEFLGHPVTNLPERYYLACSIGVMDSSSLPRPINENDLLNHADQALYEVKRTGKGRVLNFENMTHEADNQIIESNR